MALVTPASQVAELIAKYTPEIARFYSVSRRKMRAMVPRGYELVYDNYNALGIARALSLQEAAIGCAASDSDLRRILTGRTSGN